MTMKRGLGRNLSALLQTSTIVKTEPELMTGILKHLPLTQIHPGKYQPRALIDESSLSELAQSIKKQGLLQPVVVREIEPHRYELIAGERRWRACQLAECREIPVLIQQVDDETAMAMALVENLQREALNAIDQARAMKRLLDEFKLTHQEIAELLSKSRAAVSNFLRLLQLEAPIQAWIEEGRLDMGHGRCLLGLTAAQQIQGARLALDKGWSVRATEAWVHSLKQNKSKRETALKTEDYREDITHLSSTLNAKIALRRSASGKGTLVIYYEDLERLTTIMKKLQQLSSEG